MNRTYFTSDFHVGHANILKFCPETRQFSSVDDMNLTLLDAWNSVVKPEDSVYFLGDMAMNFKYTEWILPLLNGNIYWCLGNHDHAHPVHKKDKQTEAKMFKLNANLKEVFTDKIINAGKYRLRLNHFPYLSVIDNYDNGGEIKYKEWRPLKKAEHALVCGHFHSKPKNRLLSPTCLDVGWDAFGRLVELEEVMEILCLT